MHASCSGPSQAEITDSLPVFYTSGDSVLTIPGRVRETACEVMYDYNNSEQTLTHLVLDSIIKVSQLEVQITLMPLFEDFVYNIYLSL